ncbi:YihY/virulence factor BrkB family protein [Piscinibacter koreensis]|uniref:YihY/virulence factor BrkB family protein n=1 Tax=Piscinibacter koreensis TaxID=2742824 RepID=A0A7Y6NLP1_9BURK|nr:YihY/virulence factor BrkB family protein [Schlegelella koreensis]NUZ05491.1 YihY/virulence factor BrkB family protein [Schlegelella koreensis]
MNLKGIIKPSQIWPLIKQSVNAWIDDYAPSMGAALSYYTMFSIAPLLLIVISVAGLVFGDEAARGEIFAQLGGLMGADAAKGVEGLLASVSKPEEGIVATAVGLVVLLIGATTVFGELQDALDRIWRAPVRDKSGGIWGLLRARLLSFGMILGIAFLLMVSLVASAALSALGKWWAPLFGGWEVLLQIVNFLVSFVLVTGIFAMIYKIMPRVKVEWRDVWVGAAVTSLMFTIGKFLIGLYIGKSGVASAYGAAGSLVVVLLWVYYSAQVFLLGAEFTWCYAKSHGSLQGVADAAAPDAAAGVPTRSDDGVSKDAAPPKPERSVPEKIGLAVGAVAAARMVLAALSTDKPR